MKERIGMPSNILFIEEGNDELSLYFNEQPITRKKLLNAKELLGYVLENELKDDSWFEKYNKEIEMKQQQLMERQHAK